MLLQLIVFAALKDAFGSDRISLELPPGATAGDVRGALIERHPRWRALIERSRLAVGTAFVADDHPLAEGMEVALIPPVSGGAPEPAAALVTEPIDVGALTAAAVRPEAGGLAIFVGTVRSPNEGRVVRHIDYSAHEPMAVAVLGAIAAECGERWPGSRVLIRHRLDRLLPGEASVVVVAAAAHRAEAFDACRHAIERLKADAPIWKREVFEDGARWVGAPDPEDG